MTTKEGKKKLIDNYKTLLEKKATRYHKRQSTGPSTRKNSLVSGKRISSVNCFSINAKEFKE